MYSLHSFLEAKRNPKNTRVHTKDDEKMYTKEARNYIVKAIEDKGIPERRDPNPQMERDPSGERSDSKSESLRSSG